MSLVDNLDGTYDFTDAAGNTTTISDTSISTLVDNADGTYTYTDETGATQLIDTNASSNPYDNTTSGLTATDVQAALDELAAGSTDDQNISGSGLAGTDLTIGIENGTSEVVDLSSLVESVIAGTGAISVTDDGNGNYTVNSTDPDEDLTNELTLLGSGAPVVVPSNAGVTYVDTVAGQLYVWDGAVWNVVGGNASPDLDGDPTNELNTTFAVNAGNLEITDNGGTLAVPLASLGTDDQTAAEVTYDNTASGLTAIDVQAAIDELDAAAGNVALVDNLDGTYTFTDAAGNPTIISDTSISTMVDNGDGTYTYTDESGATQTIDTNASSNPYDNTASGLVATDVQAALDEVAAGSTDDQNISGSGLAGTDLTIGIENGTNEVVDLSSLVETVIAGTGAITVTDDGNGNYTVNSTDPDEDLTNELTLIGAGAPVIVPSNAGVTYVDSVAGQLYIWDGAAWNAVGGNASPDLDGDPTNEYNTGISFDGTNLTVTDAGGNQVVDISGVSTDDQDLSGASLSGANILQIDIENGASTTVDLSALDNSGTDDQTAAEVTYDNTVSGLTATEVQAALDEVAAGSTDDQNIAGSGLAGNILTIGIENGTNETVDLSALVGTDDQTATEVTYDNTVSGLTATEVQAALDEVAAGSTDDQNISGSGLAGTDLTIGIENGTNEVVDLSSLVETVIAGTGAITVTDDGNGNYTVNSTDPDEDLTNELTLIGAGAPVAVPSNAGVTYVDSVAGQLYIWDGATWNAVGGSASPDLDGDPTNEQNTAFAINAGNLEITDSGGTLGVPLASLGTDDQNISGSGLAGNILTIGIENGTNETVDLSALVGTDDQTAAEVTYDNTTSGLTASDVQSALDEVAAGSTDDQNISGSGLAGNILTIGIENGTNETVDLSALVGTDDQIASEVNITDAGGNFVSTEVEGALAELAAGSTDDQNISGSGLAGNILTIGIENGTNETVDLSALVGTDDQNLTGASLSGANILQIDIENGGSTTVDLSALDDSGTDDQTAAEVTYDNTTSGLTAADVQAALDEVAAGSTDDQNISGSGLAGNILTIGIENGTNETVDLSALVGTDDQNLTLAANSLSIEDGNSVDLSTYLDNTDEQDLTGASLSGANILQIDIENGASTTVDLSSLDDSGTDDQTISTDGSAGNISIEDGNTVVLNVDDADADATNEYNTGVGMNTGALEVTDGGGTLSTSLISTDANNDIASGSDGALYLNVSSVTISETITNLVDNANGTITYTNENGVPQTVSKANITDNANGTYTFTNNDGSDVILDTNANSNPYDNTTSGLTATDVQAALDEVATGSTDDQNISGSGLAGNILTIGIENGTNETVDDEQITVSDIISLPWWVQTIKTSVVLVWPETSLPSVLRMEPTKLLISLP